MSFSSQPAAPPRLLVQPEFINFGLIDPSNPMPGTTISISNPSGNILVGKIIPQFNWINISPDEFRVAEGQNSIHTIRLASLPTTYANHRKVTIPNLFVVNSNAGSISIGADFILSKKNLERPKQYPALILAGLILMIILVSASLFLANQLRGRYAESAATANVAMLHTQAVQTIEAGQTPSVTPTPYPKAINNQSATQTSQANQANPGVESTPGITYTPFSIDQNHNPEAFIVDYFEGINQQKPNQSWQMLSAEFQQKCCGQEGSDAYQVYLNQWKEVEKVIVVSAYILEQNANPAPINVAVQLVYLDGITVDQSNVYWIIFDDILDSFLIDDIE